MRFACIAFTYHSPVGNFAGRGGMVVQIFAGEGQVCYEERIALLPEAARLTVQ